jgi:apolipoprotein N-acyltransferase
MLKALTSLGCFAYIAFWFWMLFTSIIPWLSISVSDIGQLTIWQIIATILFFVPRIVSFPLLCLCWCSYGDTHK